MKISLISVWFILRKQKNHQPPTNKQKSHSETKQQKYFPPQKNPKKPKKNQQKNHNPVLGAWYDWNMNKKHRSKKSNDKLTALQICRSIDWRIIIAIPKRAPKDTNIYSCNIKPGYLFHCYYMAQVWNRKNYVVRGDDRSVSMHHSYWVAYVHLLFI